MRSEVRVPLLAFATLVVVFCLVLPVTWCSEQVPYQPPPTEASLSSTAAAQVRHHHHAAGRSNGTRFRQRASSNTRREQGGLTWDDGDSSSSSSSSSSTVCEMEISCGGAGRRHDDDYTSIRLPVRLPLEVPRRGNKNLGMKRPCCLRS